MILIQAIRNAMVNDLVVRNVADLAAVPTGAAEEARALRWSGWTSKPAPSSL